MAFILNKKTHFIALGIFNIFLTIQYNKMKSATKREVQIFINPYLSLSHYFKCNEQTSVFNFR